LRFILDRVRFQDNCADLIYIPMDDNGFKVSHFSFGDHGNVKKTNHIFRLVRGF